MADQSASIPVPAAPAAAATPTTGAEGADTAFAGGDLAGPDGGPIIADASAAGPDADPDFEFESEVQDPEGKPLTQKQKVKTSVVKKYLARAQELERREQAMQKYYQEQVVPLDQMMRAIRQDPRQLFQFAKQLGIDPSEAADLYVKQVVQESQMTPEQRELEQHKRELAQYKQQEKQRQEQEQQTAYQQEVTRQSNLIEANMTRAATAIGLPDDPAIKMAMTGHLRAQFQEGKRPDFQAAAQYAKKMLLGGQKQALAKMSYEEIEQAYPELLTTIRNGDILKSKVRAPGPTPKPQARRQDQGPSNLSAEEYAERMRNGG